MSKLHWDPIDELHKFDDILFTTYDDNGLLHSYDDKPAFIARTKGPINRRIKSSINTDIIASFKAVYRKESISYQHNKITYKILHHNKCEIWYNHGKIHRDEDKPALYMTVGPEIRKSKVWYRNGKIHRNNDKPAMIIKAINIYESCCISIYMYKWYTNNIVHRHKLPAIVIMNGKYKLRTQIWIENGEFPINDNAVICKKYCIKGLEPELNIMFKQIGGRYYFYNNIDVIKCTSINLCVLNKGYVLLDIDWGLVTYY